MWDEVEARSGSESRREVIIQRFGVNNAVS